MFGLKRLNEPGDSGIRPVYLYEQQYANLQTEERNAASTGLDEMPVRFPGRKQRS